MKKRKKTSFKDYLESAGGVRIDNNPRVMDFLHDEVPTGTMLALSTNNKDRLLEKLGSQNGTLRSEFLHYVWIVPFESHIFHIFTGNKGTSYEILLSSNKTFMSFRDDKEAGNLCVRFLKYVDSLLKPYGPYGKKERATEMKKRKKVVPAENFLGTVVVNVDNKKLSDAEFRQFIRNTLPIVKGVSYPEKGK